MKKIITAVTIMLCLAGTSPVFARGYSSGNHHGGNYHGYQGRSHHNAGAGIAFGLLGGILLGSALAYSTAPPPPAVVYGAPYAPYPSEVVVRQPRICVEDRTVSGEWQVNRYNGRRVWVAYAYPVVQRFQVPCY